MKGILLLDKPAGKTSFYLVGRLRRIFQEKKIGHAGTLDPFATGVMVMLIGKAYTRLSDTFLGQDKEYFAKARLGIATDTYDCDGQPITASDKIPSLAEIEQVLQSFQGSILQTPPMYSAKKIGGKKLYELARQGKTIERPPVAIQLQTTLIRYEYPFLELLVTCSKGTYIRSVAHEIGAMLGCGAHLVELQRRRSGPFTLEACTTLDAISHPSFTPSQLTLDSQGILVSSYVPVSVPVPDTY